MTIQSLPLSQVAADPNQPRKDFPDDHIRELAQSIAAHGLLQPISVRPAGEGFIIIAGECRFRAHEMLAREGKLGDAPTIKAIVVTGLAERDVRVLSVIENLLRRDMNPIEEANAFQSLIDLGKSPAEVAGDVKKSVGYVNSRLAFLKLDSVAQGLVKSGNLQSAFAAEIAGLPSHMHTKFVRKVAAGEFKNLDQIRAACGGVKEAMQQESMFGAAPVASDADLRTVKSMESRIATVADMIAKGWKDGECQIAKKVDPNRTAHLADQIKAIRSALNIMEFQLRQASAAADLLTGPVLPSDKPRDENFEVIAA